jgi:hypothetical protein
MNLENVKDISKEKLLSMMGVKVQSPASTWLSFAGLLGLGMLVGAGAALLLAPKTGREVRASLSGGLKKVGRRASSVVPFVH